MAAARLSVRADPLLSIPLVLLMLAAMATALVAFRIGSAPFGTSWSSDAQACVETMEAPGQALPEPPSAAARTWLPLGVVCSVDLDGDGRPEIAVHQSWSATITAMVACFVALVMLLWLVLGLLRRRASRVGPVVGETRAPTARR